ncbi:MAG: dUTP diphosphatase [Tissierellia bacterium]|nr:dUTP diphosphatase [Tissierellia bacterium]
MIVKVVNKSKNLLPKYASNGAAGMDLRACLTEPIVLKSGKTALVPTGLYMEIPQGYELQIRCRSGLALKHGIGLVNGIGTIDSDYRGEIGVILINFGEEDFTIQPGDRIAQCVLNKFETIEWSVTDTLEESERGEGGFGSTGV